MSEPPVVHTVARNNAEWCDAFCRTYGIAGRFRADSWSSPVRTPPHYPDAVTLLPEAEVAQLLSGIDTSEGCSVKDSFADLDLTQPDFDRCSVPSGCTGRRVTAGRCLVEGG